MPTKITQSICDTRFDAIVIGSGMGGMGAACILAKHGLRVAVLERHRVAGGLTHTFRRRGFEWDVGVHALGKLHDRGDLRRRLFDYLSEGALQWSHTGPICDVLRFPDGSFELPSHREAFRDALVGAFPEERRAVDRYLRLLDRVEKASRLYFAAKLLPSLLRPLAPLLTGWFRHHSDRTTDAVLRSLSRNPRFIGVLTGRYGNYGAPPRVSSFAMHALAEEHYLEGATYPVGGPGRIASTFVPLIERSGGVVVLGAEVDHILVERRRAIGVRLRGGQEIRADVVISNAGVANTVARLLPADVTQGMQPKLQRLHSSLGHVALYLGLRGTPDQLGLPRHNLWVHSGYDHDANLSHYLTSPGESFPTVVLSSPSAKDPSRQGLDRSTLVAIAPAEFAWFSAWSEGPWRRRGRDYDALKATFAARLRAAAERALPGIGDRVEWEELSTPLSTRHFVGHPEGSMYGFDHRPERFRQAWLGPRGPVRDLYFVGQDVVSVGVGAALVSSALTTSLILRRNVLGDAMRA